MSLIEELRTKRQEARESADELLTRAAAEERDLTADESRDYQDRSGQLREIEDRLEQLRDDEIRELRAATVQPTTEFPLGEWLTRAVTSGAFSPTDFPSTFFDRLAARSVGLASGFSVITTNRADVSIPRVTGDTSASWVDEGGTITSTSMTSDSVVATPRKLAGLETVSNEALADSSPSLMERIGSGLVRSLALQADLGFFEGTGTAPQIQGLRGTAGVQSYSMGTDGATPSNLDAWGSAIGMLEEANATASAIVMHPRDWATLLLVKESDTGNNKPLLQESAGSGSQGVRRSLYGVPVFLSSQLSTTETKGTSSTASSSYVYQADEIVVVRRADVSVEVDRSRLFNSDQSEIRAITRLDMVTPNPAAVVRINGLLGS